MQGPPRPLAVTPTLRTRRTRPRRAARSCPQTSPAQGGFPGKVRRLRPPPPCSGVGERVRCLGQHAESACGRTGEGRRLERARRTASSRGARTPGGAGTGARAAGAVVPGRGLLPQLWALPTPGAGPPASRCGGGGAELGWLRRSPVRAAGGAGSLAARSRATGFLPSHDSQRGTRARAGQGFSVRTLGPVPGSFFPFVPLFLSLTAPGARMLPARLCVESRGGAPGWPRCLGLQGMSLGEFRVWPGCSRRRLTS